MGRPRTPTALIDRSKYKKSNDELDAREEMEKKLKGNNDKLKPPTYMSKNAKKIFKWVIKEFENIEVLGNLDLYVLEQFSNTYANYRELEEMYNKEKDIEKKEKIFKLKKGHSADLKGLYNELGMTPSARSRLGALNLHKQEEENDPVLQLVAEMKRLENR